MYTVAQKSQGLYKEKGSEFISFLYPVCSKYQIDEILRQVRKEYFDARHICYAYKLDKTEYCTDGGEPSHTAGNPILRQIQAYKLNNVLLVVIRYFGGTKLGVPGLIHAYQSAAQEAIRNNTLVEWQEKQRVKIECSYAQASIIKNIIRQHSVEIINSSFEENCNFLLDIPKEKWFNIQTMLEKYTLKVTILEK
ncbi:MAG: YigZ family protein [Bacteroidia bacterium]|nr:YigZ family protein [Bacteroidia bacterium]MDW8157275.1 YigZ family protein [Bacteroidia bacterium]